jgi:hypothetical protein
MGSHGSASWLAMTLQHEGLDMGYEEEGSMLPTSHH